MKTLLKNKKQTCLCCGINFTNKSLKKYCSKTCYYKSLEKKSSKELINCDNCNKPFEFYKYKKRKFCSEKCAKGNCSKFRIVKKNIYGNCEICNAVFIKKNRTSKRCENHYKKRANTPLDKIVRNCLKCDCAYISKNLYYCSKICSMSTKDNLVNDFSELDSINAYFSGFIFGDGHVDHRSNTVIISLSQKYYGNYNILKQMSEYIFGYNRVIKYDNNFHYTLKINSSKFVKNLQKFGMYHNKKSLYDILNLPQYYTKDFIRGYFDADGWASTGLYYNKKYKKYYESRTIGLCSYRIENIQKVIKYIGVDKNIYSKKSQQLYNITYSSKSDIKNFNNLINGYPRLEHKWQKIEFMNHSIN